MNRKGEESKSKSDRPPWEGRDRSYTPLGFLFFGMIGATAMVARLRRTFHWFYSQVRNSEYYWSNGGGGPHKSEAWIRYRRRIQEFDEDERERVERIRRMQSVFNRERNKHKQNQETWTGTGTGSYQHFPREDWYERANQYYAKKDANYHFAPGKKVGFVLSHHYSILGLDRYRSEPYSDEEIKCAFRKKALEFHPDQNQDNKKNAEAKFKEVMVSYEAIKMELNNSKTC